MTAFQRIRQGRYQIGTVAEPLHLQGWMCIDELNRAFAGQPPSGFVPPPHLFVASNLDRDGGPNNFYEPENGYKDIYRKIWEVSVSGCLRCLECTGAKGAGGAQRAFSDE